MENIEGFRPLTYLFDIFDLFDLFILLPSYVGDLFGLYLMSSWSG